MDRIRLTSKDVYLYYLKKMDISGGCTNKRILGDNTGVEANVLRNLFGDKDKWYYEDEEVVIIRCMTKNIIKGKQSISRKGKGGMEVFAKYVRHSF